MKQHPLKPQSYIQKKIHMQSYRYDPARYFQKGFTPYSGYILCNTWLTLNTLKKPVRNKCQPLNRLSSKSIGAEVYIYQNACYYLSTHQEKKIINSISPYANFNHFFNVKPLIRLFLGSSATRPLAMQP